MLKYKLFSLHDMMLLLALHVLLYFLFYIYSLL